MSDEAKVDGVVVESNADGSSLVVKGANGVSATLDGEGPTEYAPGDCVRVLTDGDKYRIDRRSGRGDEMQVGVIREIVDQGLVVEVGYKLVIVPINPGLKLHKRATVSLRLGVWMEDILSPDPIRQVEIGESIDALVDRTLVNPENITDTRETLISYDAVKQRVANLILLPLKESSAFENVGLKPGRGILLTGPPGTGKTTIARAVAKEAKATFFLISGPEIVSKFFGDTERAMRAVFDRAAVEAPSIVFIDEIDSIAPSRDSTQHEFSHQKVAQLLTLMDGFHPDKNVVVLAATNRADAIDAALRRPGRFDTEVEFPLPDVDERKQILEGLQSRYSTHGAFPHEEVATRTQDWSPADLVGVWKEAAVLAVADRRDSIVAEDYVEAVTRAGSRVTQRQSRPRGEDG